MEAATRDDILPTTVLTGFLGSGKTTLLRRALAAPDFTDTAVIVNEIGAVAIDHYLVDVVEGAVLELPGGCLCCAVREDVARTFRELIDRRDAGTVRPFRRIVIETSGLADPAPILYTLGADPMLDARLRLGRVVTVVDAENGAATLARFAEATRQAAMADALVISKTDLAPISAQLEAALAGLNPGAERIIGQAANNPENVLFGGARSPHPNPPPLAGEGARHRARLMSQPSEHSPSEHLPENPLFHRTAQTTPSPTSGRGLGWGPEAVHTHGIDSFTVILGGEITRLDFAKALGALAGAHGSDLLRVKGIVAFADRPGITGGGQPALVQAAQHTMFAPEWLDDWPDSDRRSRLVFVVNEIPRVDVLAYFAFAAPAILGPPVAHQHAGERPAFHHP